MTRTAAQISPQATSVDPTSFGGSIPRRYDEDLGPLLFDFAARDLACRTAAGDFPNRRVLEIACGTGIATEHLWQELPSDVEIVATDLNPDMLDRARERRGRLANVTYRTADAQTLPFDDDEFDAVVCQFGIMFFPDKLGAVAEIGRVLRPGGRLLFNVWDSMERNRVAKIAHETIGTFFEAAAPAFLHTPFGYHALDPIRELLHATGLTDLSVHVVSTTVEHDAQTAARGLVEGTPGMREIESNATAEAQTVVAAVAAALEAAYGSSRPRFELQEIVFECTKPPRPWGGHQ